MFRAIVSFLVFVVPHVFAAGEYGWDTSAITQQSVIDCLEAKNDAQFIVFNGMYYNDVCDEVCGELNMAVKSGIPKRDVKFSPCPTCSASAATQIKNLVTYLNTTCTSNAWSGRLWLDVKTYGYWPTPWREAGWVKNQMWFEEMVDACMSTPGITCGIQSDINDYKYILGSDSYTYAPATTLPLWYSSLNEVASFDDFKAFGGFTTPYAKQFVYMLNTCNAGVLYQDWAPEW